MDIDRGAQPNLLAGGVEATPIAQLHPDIRDPGSKVVDGVITITWPYSTIKKSIAFILAENDVRLRRDRGSLRIEFYGAAGKAVESSGIGAGDRVRLRLEGADWEQNEPNPRLPWTLEWRLRFRNRLHMTIQRDESEQVETIDLDSSTEREQESPEPDYDLSVLFEAQRPSDSISTPTLPTPTSPIKRTALGPENGEYASPAFLKRARVAYGSLLEGGLDWFDDAEQRRKKRRRSGFGMNATWRYSSRSPSPGDENLTDDTDVASEPEALNRQPVEPASQPPMVDQGCQTQELDYSLSMGVQVAAESRLTGKIIQSTPTPQWRYEDLSSSANGPLPLSLHHDVSPIPQAHYQQHDVNGMRQDATVAMPNHDYDFAMPRHHAYTERITDHLFSSHHAFKSAPLIIDPSLQFHNVDGHHQGYHTVPAEVWEAEPSMAAHPPMSLKAGPEVSDNLSEHTPRSPDMEMPSPPHHKEMHVSVSDRQDVESQVEEAHNALGDDYEGEDQHAAGEEETEEEEEDHTSLQSHDAEEYRTDTMRQHIRNQEASIDNTVDETSDDEEKHHCDCRSQDYAASEEQYDVEDYDSHQHNANDYTRIDDDENEYGVSSEDEEEEEDDEEEEEDEDGYDSEEEEDEEEYDDIEFGHAPPSLQAPQEPVVISLLSDSEDEDDGIQAKADQEPHPERTWMSSITKPLARREDVSEREEVNDDKASEKDVEMGDGSDASELDEDADNDNMDAASMPHRSLSQMDGCDDEIQHETMEVETHVMVEHVINDAQPAEETKMPEPTVEEMREAEMHEAASPPHSAEPEVLEEGKAIVAPDKKEEGQGAPRPVEPASSFEAVAEPTVSAVDATAMEPPEVETAMELQLNEPTETIIEIGLPSIENATSPIEETSATNIEARQLDVEDTGSNEVGDAIEQEDIAMKDAIDEPLTQDLVVEEDRNLEQSHIIDMPEVQDEHHHENELQPGLVEEVAQEQEPSESRNHHLEEPHVPEEEAAADSSLNPEMAEILKAASLPRATRSRQSRLEPLSEEISTQQSSLPVLPHKEAQADDSFSTAAGPAEQEEEQEEEEEGEDDLSADQQLVEEFSASQPSCHHSFDGAHDEPLLVEQHHPGQPGRSEPVITPHALRSQCRLHRKSLSAESNKMIDENGSQARESPIKHCLVDDDLPKSLWFLPRSRDEYSDPSVALARAFEVALESDGAEKRRLSLSGLFRVSGRQVLDPSVVLAHSTSPPSKLRPSSPRRKGEQQDISVRPATASPRNARRQNASPTRSTRVTNSPVSTVADSSFGSESISIMKTQLLKSLRASLPDCLPLRGLRNSLNKVTDILAVATSAPMQPHRPKHGPRDYLLEVFITDPSTAPTGVNVVHIFRPHLSSLPVIHTGDVVLLRRVQVVSMQGRGFGFRAGDASAWAVFERGDEEMLPQIKGPPVEVSDEEVEYVKGLRAWWEALDEKAMEKMVKANRKLSQPVTGSHAHDDSR